MRSRKSSRKGRVRRSSRSGKIATSSRSRVIRTASGSNCSDASRRDPGSISNAGKPAEHPVEEIDPIEVLDVFLRQVAKGVDVGDLEADANESGLPRASRSVEVHDGAAGNQEATVDARFPQDQVGATHWAPFSSAAVQPRSEEVRRHGPVRRGGRSDEVIDGGERLRDFFRRKAVAQPLTSINHLAIRQIYSYPELRTGRAGDGGSAASSSLTEDRRRWERRIRRWPRQSTR